jgi:hypothetical protein
MPVEQERRIESVPAEGSPPREKGGARTRTLAPEPEAPTREKLDRKQENIGRKRRQGPRPRQERTRSLTEPAAEPPDVPETDTEDPSSDE